jgi:hypothetical protein
VQKVQKVQVQKVTNSTSCISCTSCTSTRGQTSFSLGDAAALIAAFGLPTEPEPGRLAIADDAIGGVHITRLAPDGLGKAGTETDKIMVGISHGSPIVLAPPNDLLGLLMAEGIEDALSGHEATGLGAWAAGSASRLPALAESVPYWIEAVTILAHDDREGRRHAATLASNLRHRACTEVQVIVLAAQTGIRLSWASSRTQGEDLSANERINAMRGKLPMHLSRRCGARTRSGSGCRSPAMPNGRCRMHGGNSPGAPKGNKNALKHGHYTAEAIAQRREISDLLRAMKALASGSNRCAFDRD